MQEIWPSAPKTVPEYWVVLAGTAMKYDPHAHARHYWWNDRLGPRQRQALYAIWNMLSDLFIRQFFGMI
ncbi:hypothetical protein [Ruegeria sp. MALMAid1280]|uniref:hypothetical protein n=1 Tax=Ruegeria sp. MALMAid1280 TaxID=3411634 RepID=UPI003BA287B3